MSNDNKSINLTGIWKNKTKSGRTFYASNNITFGELRNLLKEFKEDKGVSDGDIINFFLFKVDSENEKAPYFHLNINKNNYKERR
jgi:hypothetical protein